MIPRRLSLPLLWLNSDGVAQRQMSGGRPQNGRIGGVDSLDVEDDLLQHTITDSTEAAQYEDKRSSLDITDCIPMLLQDENINDLNPETNNAVTNVEILSNTNNDITNEEKLSDINNLISNAEQFTNNVVLNNIVENQNNKDPERNDAAQSNHEIPTLLENESQIQSTVQNRDLNKSTDSNMNGLTNGTRKKTLIQSNTQILKYHCKSGNAFTHAYAGLCNGILL
ncbi:hypothetical protein RR48_02233 [Papilio machaon]|uniref:Uncharacterized protein n=1 Tax=Papilio machaon TaxID=76193 RepID=A0A0N0PBZ8_PAPMA|nr:hypothetical protein RR48_02233 [Papilio machaon]